MSDARESAHDPPAGEARLESWKEIAAYLRRDVRTVQRWEQTDGLPIHRHKRTHRPIPYAYKSELDAWWTGRAGVSERTDRLEDSGQRPRDRRVVAIVATLAIVAVTVAGASWAVRSRPFAAAPTASEPDASSAAAAAAREPEPHSVAVLPFVDLTEGMTHEEFADGMTEEIIHRLNAVPGYRVPAPASTFYFKGKDVPVTDIARALGVAFVADGSVRRSGATVRVAARLIRADGVDVIWSQTYDRPWTDVLHIQDDIAESAAQAITRSISASVIK